VRQEARKYEDIKSGRESVGSIRDRHPPGLSTDVWRGILLFRYCNWARVGLPRCRVHIKYHINGVHEDSLPPLFRLTSNVSEGSTKRFSVPCWGRGRKPDISCFLLRTFENSSEQNRINSRNSTDSRQVAHAPSEYRYENLRTRAWHEMH